MNRYFKYDLGISETPKDVLLEVAEEMANSSSRLKAKVTESALNDRVVFGFEVSTTDSPPLGARLFEASHRLEGSYPVLIVPPTDDVPEFLRKKKTIKGNVAALTSAFIPDKVVENFWVCSSPSEFRSKLEELLSQDRIKYRILSLLAPHKVSTDTGMPDMSNERGRLVDASEEGESAEQGQVE